LSAGLTPSGPVKADEAFRTIGELAEELGLPQHILRYWETRFTQLRPLQRAGKRRYYRPADVALARRIDRLLNHEGYTIRGVQKLLDARVPESAEPPQPQLAQSAAELEPDIAPPPSGRLAASVDPAHGDLRALLTTVRATLAAALRDA
jgi:DNA-binding transcriptional MerR regulator